METISIAYFCFSLSSMSDVLKDLCVFFLLVAQLQLNISLVRTTDGMPKFFNCALSEVEENMARGRSSSTLKKEYAT